MKLHAFIVFDLDPRVEMGCARRTTHRGSGLHRPVPIDACLFACHLRGHSLLSAVSKFATHQGYMGQVNYVGHDGTRYTIEVADGETLMVGATSNSVPGIDGDCGGCAACGTCHVHIDASWLAAVGPATDAEKDMLQFADGVAEDSRLSCQVRMRADLNGIVVHLPESQH